MRTRRRGEPAEPDDLVVLVVRAAKAMVEDLRARRPPGGAPLPVVHGLAAHYLLRHDNVTVSEVARYLKITKQSASEIVAALEDEGIVQRVPHPSDGRARVVQLTSSGRTKLDDGRRRWQELESEWAARIGRDHLDLVRDALTAYLATDDANARSLRPA